MLVVDKKCQQSEDIDTAEGQTLAEQVYHRLSADILSGALAPGAKISEPALAQQYGVSRGPLREALHRLQERKLITRSANQGARVVKLTPETLVELFAVREALEGMAARLAALNATEADIAAMRASLGDGPDGPAEPRPSHDDDFHFAVAQSSRNPMLINLLCGELSPLLRLYRGQPGSPRPHARRAILEHGRVIAAIEDRDPDLAEMMMRRHIAAARARRGIALGGHAAPDIVA